MLTKVVSPQQHAARPNKAGTPVTSGMKAAVGTRGTSLMSPAAGPPESVGNWKVSNSRESSNRNARTAGAPTTILAPVGTPTEGADMLGTSVVEPEPEP